MNDALPLALSPFQARMQLGARWCLAAAFLLIPVFLGLGNVALALALLLSLFTGAYRPRWQSIRRIPTVWWALGLYALVLLGVLYTPASAEDINTHLSKYGKLLLIPALLPLLNDAVWRRRCFYAFLLGMGFILLSMYANIFFILPWSATKQLGWGVDHTVVGDYITQSIMMSFFAILTFEQGRRSASASAGAGGHWLTGFWYACSFFSALAITQLSPGRTGYALLAAASAIYLWHAFKGRARLLYLAGVALILSAMLLSSHMAIKRVDQGINETETSQSMAITSLGGRVNFWKNTWKIVQEKPLQGWGTGSYHSVWCQHVTEPGWCEFGGWHPHNQYLFFWMELGLAGLALYLLLVSSPIWLARMAAPQDRAILWGFLAIFAGDSLINSPLFSSRESHFFVLFLIWLSAQAYWGGQSPATMSSAPQNTKSSRSPL